MTQEFGYGKAGKVAREIIETSRCKECGGVAVKTIDFDLNGELWQVPACASHACYQAIRETAESEMRRLNQVDTVNTFSENGLGRP